MLICLFPSACINLAVSQIIEPDWVWAAAHRDNITQDSATAA